MLRQIQTLRVSVANRPALCRRPRTLVLRASNAPHHSNDPVSSNTPQPAPPSPSRPPRASSPSGGVETNHTSPRSRRGGSVVTRATKTNSTTTTSTKRSSSSTSSRHSSVPPPVRMSHDHPPFDGDWPALGGDGGDLSSLTPPTSSSQPPSSPSSTPTDLPLHRYRVLVLDCSYRPVLIVPWWRGIVLSFGKAEVLEYYHKQIRSSRTSHPIPAVVRVAVHVQAITSARHARVALNRRNILLRDSFTCQYCSVKANNLTIDHVMPLSRGGRNEWTNVVAACSRCNGKKANRLLHELGWKLVRQPREPRPFAGGWGVSLNGFPGGTLRDVALPPVEWRGYLEGLQGDDYGEWVQALKLMS